MLYLKISRHQLEIWWCQIEFTGDALASPVNGYLRPLNRKMMLWNFQIQYSYLLITNQEYYTTTLELELQCISLSISVKENKVAASYTKYFFFPLFNIFCIYYGYSSFYDDLWHCDHFSDDLWHCDHIYGWYFGKTQGVNLLWLLRLINYWFFAEHFSWFSCFCT